MSFFVAAARKQERNAEIIVINFADSEHEGIEEIIKLRDIIYCVWGKSALVIEQISWSFLFYKLH